MSKDIVSLKRASDIDCVCHGKESYEDDFFYDYTNIFTQLHVWIPFDEFTIGVLRLLNVAPTQVHPNGRGYIQAFKLLCKWLYIDPSLECFLYFYCTHPREPASWVSLIRKPKAPLFRSYSDSFRNFKRRFFRIIINKSG
ncbi:hypothetical protein VIGAN_05114400 [Vigna angularis var. angularis]|uniref:Transposase (putative) gypsy type domain-containing protein n=1 Tax=Vigna angularis var. angularis TaxID=157739 RepID=A0A0S3S4K0_PHAAN|nr:hypothetical protein VIGAN_05114400 [Vigna angularis var. angularis]